MGYKGGMKTEEKSVAQYQASFRTDRQCERHIFAIKYGDGFKCRKCDHQKYYEIIRYGLMYACRKCRHHESAKAGTIFEHSRVPLRKWFQAILEITICKGGIAATTLQRRLGLGQYRTAWTMLHKLRKAMEQKDEGYELSGLLELDGVNLGDKKKDGTKNKFYMAVQERTQPGDKRQKAGFAKMVCVDQYGKGQVSDFVGQHIKPGSTVKIDGGLDLNQGLIDMDVEVESKVMHGLKYRLEKHLPWVARLTYNIKATLVGTHRGVSPKYLSSYMSGQLYRFNRRFWPKQLQTRLVRACVLASPITIAELCA